MKIEFDFLPASLNQLFDMHYRARAKWTKERKETVAWLVKQYEPITEPVDIHFLMTSGNKHKKDSSNYTGKACLDGLVLGGLLKDDNTDYVRKVSFEMIYGEKDKTIIELSPIAK